MSLRSIDFVLYVAYFFLVVVDVIVVVIDLVVVLVVVVIVVVGTEENVGSLNPVVPSSYYGVSPVSRRTFLKTKVEKGLEH